MGRSPVNAHQSSARRSQGFTLLELLVVLVIAAVLVSLVGLSSRPNPHERLKTDAERLALLLDAASDEAQLRGHPIAWQPVSGGYRFLEARGTEWAVLHDELFRAAQWGDEIESTSIQVSGNAPGIPLLVLANEAVAQPVLVQLNGPDGEIAIAGNGLGHFIVVTQ